MIIQRRVKIYLFLQHNKFFQALESKIHSSNLMKLNFNRSSNRNLINNKTNSIILSTNNKWPSINHLDQKATPRETRKCQFFQKISSFLNHDSNSKVNLIRLVLVDNNKRVLYRKVTSRNLFINNPKILISNNLTLINPINKIK